MLIKSAAEREQDLRQLNELLQRPDATDAVRERIQKEIRNIRAGAKGEAEAAYEINFHLGTSRNWAVIHDLRLEWQGRVAQIDHLLISRTLGLWVCESKHFAEGVSINEQGEFTAFHDRRAYGVPSPIEQNRKHALLLQQVMGSSIVSLPTRLGLALRPTVETVVLVSKGARITRPKANIDGLDRVIKADQLRTMLTKTIDDESVASSLVSMTKLISSETLETFAKSVAALHRPLQFDWLGKFGLPTVPPAAVEKPVPVRTSTPSLAFEKVNRVVVPSPAPTSPADSAPGAEATDVHEGRLSTSKLATAMGVRSSKEVLDALVGAGLLEVSRDGHRLTDEGQRAGGRYVEKSRFGPYFLWPKDLRL